MLVTYEIYKELSENAALGDTNAMNYLGFSYSEGNGFIKYDLDKAIYWYKKSYNLGDKEARFGYAECLIEAQRNLDFAIKLLKTLAKEGDVWASLSLARLYLDGLIVPKDAEQGLRHLKEFKTDLPEIRFLYGRYNLLSDGKDADVELGISSLDALIKEMKHYESILTLCHFFKVLYEIDNESYEAGSFAYLYAKLNHKLDDDYLDEILINLEKTLPQEYKDLALEKLKEYL